MNKQDFEHLAQVGLSVKAKIGQVFDEDEFDRYIDRMIWAINASPQPTANLDETWFRKRCKGETFDAQ